MRQIAGGTEVTFSVYSSNKYKRLVYENLHGIAVDGGILGAPLNAGDRKTVLGFFSVNLKHALDAIPDTADLPGKAWAVEAALEFFVFGKATKAAWPPNMKCK